MTKYEDKYEDRIFDKEMLEKHLSKIAYSLNAARAELEKLRVKE